jgi:O-antigen/teichoic acid export membrane protein
MMYINLAVALINIIGNLVFIPYFSFIGSAWVTLASQICLLFLTFYFARHMIEKSWMIRTSLFVLLSSFIAGAITFALSGILFGESSTFVSVFLELSFVGMIFWGIYLSILFLIQKRKLS